MSLSPAAPPMSRKPRYAEYGWNDWPRRLSNRRLARMARELDPDLRCLVAACSPSDWSDPNLVLDRLAGLLTHRHRVGWRLRRRWLPVYRMLSGLEQLMLVDAHINRRGLPETWLFRAGVVDLCAEQIVAIPAWPMPRWPLNATLASGETVVHMALSSKPWVVSQLLEWGADPNPGNGTGRSPLHLAAEAPGSDLISVLVAHRARCTARDGRGCTPLEVALGHSNYFAAIVLLKAGAPVEGVGHHLDALRFFARSLNEQRVMATLDAWALARALRTPEETTMAPARRRL